MTTPTVFDSICLNESPDLSMEEITRSLFNNQFLSDIQFKFEANVIFAHTWELKKRSVIFQQEFRKIGAEAVVPINDIEYTVFYEFVRFIYTDECDINEYNRTRLLKLALKYKVVRLETKLINGLSDCLEIFEFCVVEKYDLLYNMMREWMENQLHTIESNIKLETMPPEVLEEILKLDYLHDFDEVKIFNLVMRWITYISEKQHITFAERRIQFDKFIRLIRFPVMTIEQFTESADKYVDLFTKKDIVSIFRQIALGDQCTDCIWNPKPRLNSFEPYRTIAIASHWEVQFNVLSNVILRGVRFGFCNFKSDIRITVIGKDLKSNSTDKLTFNFDKTICNDSEMVINLGETIELKPNYEYSVEIDTENGLKVPLLRDNRRPKIQDVAINLAQPQAVRKLKETTNLLEIIFVVRKEIRSTLNE